MSAIALLGFLFFAGVDIAIAPDQPLPYVYMDDPVILELRSDRDMTADVDIRVQARHHDDPMDIRLEGLVLPAGGSYWATLDTFPEERGFYAAHVTVTGSEASAEKDLLFCRIDRPSGRDTLPVYARSDAWNRESLLALRNAGVRDIRINLALPDHASQMALAEALHFRVIPRVQATDPGGVEEAISLMTTVHQAYGNSIAWWKLACDDAPERVPKVAEALRRLGCTTPLTLVVRDVAHVPELLASNQIKYLDALVLLPNEAIVSGMKEIRRALATAGYERIPVYLDGAETPGDMRHEGPALVRNLFACMAAGADNMAFDSDLVYNGAVREALPYLAGLSRRINATRYVGRLPAGKGVTANVFREGARWLVAAWTENGRGTVSVPAEGTDDLLLTDALNNPLPLPAPAEGQLVLEVGPSPTLLTGAGGRIAGCAARMTALTLARDLAGDATLAEARPAYLTSLIVRTADLLEKEDLFQNGKQKAGSDLRPLLLDMLRVFPALEYRWQSGETPKIATLTLVAGLARLTRVLCIVEEARGEPFIEPLGDRLASCEEHQSLYLTSQTGDSPFAARGEQLLAEVRRLMEDARALAKAGRAIEAHGVAALAEWRARSLNALQEGAPLAPPPPEPVVEETPAAEPVPPPKPVEVLEPGQPAGTRKVIHTVSRGDNPSAIAKKYGVELTAFMKWNKLSRRSILSIGQQLKVYVKRENE